MVEQYSDPDRMDKLEAQVEKAMTKFETQLEKALARMEAKMDTWQQNYVSKEVLDDKLKLRDERIERLEQEKNTNKNTAPLWVGAIFTGISLIIMIYSLMK